MSTTVYTYSSQPRTSAAEAFGTSVTYRTIGYNSAESAQYPCSVHVPRSMNYSFSVEGLGSSAQFSQAQPARSSRATRIHVPGRGAYWMGNGDTSISRQVVQSGSREARWLPGGNTTKSHVRLQNETYSHVPPSAALRTYTTQPVQHSYQPVQHSYQPVQHSFPLSAVSGHRTMPTVSYRTLAGTPTQYRAVATTQYRDPYYTTAAYDTASRSSLNQQWGLRSLAELSQAQPARSSMPVVSYRTLTGAATQYREPHYSSAAFDTSARLSASQSSLNQRIHNYY